MVLNDKSILELCTKSFTKIEWISRIFKFRGNDNINERYSQLPDKSKMIEPFVEELVREVDDKKIISYGLSSMGYDVRLAETVKIFTNANAGVVDPMEHNEDNFISATIKTDSKGLRYFILPPNSYALGHTLETFNIPKDVLVLCLGKSTYARASIIVNTTPIEPGFCGQVVIELANGCSSPVKVYIDGGIAQFVFLLATDVCSVSYADRNGKYQNQKGLTHSKV